jgi:hypothetical protein
VIPESSHPSIQRFLAWKNRSNGELVAVADDEIVSNIERGQRPAQGRIQRIHLFAQTGGLIERFAERICGQQLQRSARVAECHLQGVVVGVADGGLQGIASKIWSQRPSGPVDHPVRCCGENIAFAERSARSLPRSQIGRIAEFETQGRVAGIV